MKKLILAYSVAAIGLSATAASAEEGQVKINPAVGYIGFDSDRDLDDSALGALGLEYQIDKHWAVEVVGLDLNADHDVLSSDVDVRALRLDGLYYLDPKGDWVPYLAAGLGRADFDFGVVDYEEDQLNVGGGARYLIDEALSARADLRLIRGLDNSTWDSLVTLGISYAFGGTTSKPAPAPEPAPVKEAPAEPAPAPAPAPVEPAKPVDSDNDGIVDTADKCADTPKDVKVDAAGCPLDTDKDGVSDYLDKCPESAPDARVDSKGCKLKKVRVDEIKLHVQFPVNSSVVKPASMGEIEKVASFMKKHTDLVVDIEGHTDSLGKASYNKYLSQRRADSVAKLLVEKFGIEAGRVKSVGYGEANPIESNDTAEGRQKNRRVVAVLQKEVEE